MKPWFFCITLIIFTLSSLKTFSQVDLSKGLMAYYPFNGNANDASGNGNNPVFNNATLTSDFYGNANSAYHFNGTNNYIQIPNSSTLNFSDNKISLCAWVRPTGFYTGPCYNNMLISKETVDYVPGNYSLRFADAITGCSSDANTQHEVFYGPDGGIGNQDAVELNKWYNVVFTSDGIRAKLFVNCQLVVDEPVSQGSYTNPYDLFLGHLNDGTYSYWLNGDLDEVRIYNRALSEDEVHAYSGVCTADSKVTASFTGPDTVCVNTPVQFTNTTQNASNYLWSFCSDFKTTPTAASIGVSGSPLNLPVFIDYGLDDNGNYYGIVTNHLVGRITRLNFGNSLLNVPTAEDLGDFNGALPQQLEGVQLEHVNGKWYAIAVGGGNEYPNSSPRIVKLDFGNSLANTPVATNWGNIGDLNLPIDFSIIKENGYYYGFTMNVYSNTITRFDFGTDFINPPNGVNLGNIGNLDYPDGLTFVKNNDTWYGFAVNTYSGTITRLNFSSSLTSIPTATVINNPNNLLSRPRDITLLSTCNGIFGYVINADDNKLIKLNFGSDITNANPEATDLGSFDFYFPHSFSNFFTVGGDIYSFVPNVNSNSIDRLKFAGCTDISSSTKQNPDPVTYTSTGNYTVSLMVDIGLPTQTSFCKPIVVKDCNNHCDTFKVDAGNDISICYGDSTQLNAAGGTTYNWNASASLSDTIISNPFASPLKTESFILTGYNNTGCSDTDTVKVTVMPLPVINLTNDTAVCIGGSVLLNTNAQGNNTFNWAPSAGLSASDISNPVASPQSATKYFVRVTGANNCAINDSVFVDVLPLPSVSTINDASICMNDSILLITNVSNASIIQWIPSTGLSSATIRNPKASPSTSTLYKIVAGNGICNDKDSVLISVLPLPKVQTNNDTTVCGIASVQLNASGAASYTWLPSTGLNNAAVANPVASPNATTTYVVKGVDINGCVNIDSVSIAVNPTPQFSLSPQNTSLCSGDSVVLAASGGDIYNWSPTQYLSNASSSTTTAYPSQDINYSVTITNTVCKTTEVLTTGITVKELPVVTATKSNDIDCLSFTSQLTATGGINYSWFPSTYISNVNISNPVVSPPSDTKYFVTASGSNGCKNKDSILVVSNLANLESVKFEVANAFTPNNDGLNDCFSVKYWGPADAFDMSIYNRWGQIVFHSNNINNCWDGNYMGLPQPASTYVYVITVSAKCSNGVLHKKGTLVLLR